MDVTINKHGRVRRTDGKPLNLSEKDEREIRRLLTFKKRLHQEEQKNKKMRELNDHT